MLSKLQDIIPGANFWPTFIQNKSEVFESRVCTVKIKPNNCIFLKDMEGSLMPIVVAHGEGQTFYENSIQHSNKSCISFCCNDGSEAGSDDYPFNPNGSVSGETGFCSDDGRVLIMMPHPERVSRTISNTWMHKSNYGDSDLEDEGSWMRLFHNAREWCEKSRSI